LRYQQAKRNSYFLGAFSYFRRKNATFIVVTDTPEWVAAEHLFNAPDIVHPSRSTAEKDMALLASCDHIIISEGTFGWWAAWLGAGARQGTVMYYEDANIPEFWGDGHNVTKAQIADTTYPKAWLAYDGVKPL